MILICLLFCFCCPPQFILSAHLRLLLIVLSHYTKCLVPVHKQKMNTNYRMSLLIVSRQEKNNSGTLYSLKTNLNGATQLLVMKVIREELW